MNTSVAKRIHRLTLAGALMLGFPLLLVAGEKANVTLPAPRKIPSNLDAPAKQSPFRALEGNSIGGVTDRGAGPELPAVETVVPDARTQKEMMERLDRKRNFLLDDGVASQADNQPIGGERAQEEVELLITPRRPQTVLEKRLRQGSTPAKEETSSAERMDESADEIDNDLGILDLTGLGVSNQSKNLDPLGTRDTSSRSLSGLNASTETVAIINLEDLRSSLNTAGGRGLGLDELSRQRLERYQQLSGDGESLRRGFGSDPAELGRTRELRAVVVDSYYSPASAEASLPKTLPIDTADPSLDSTGGRRPGSSLDSLFNGVQANPYSPSSAPTTPNISPAAKLLSEPRPQPPRFRP
ncbi:MAG: hypothetical protein J0M24_06330 [Verrucomicrobia bacterium]|nr:hypothetical protein [Verrucomicrobiota bacterium]